MNVASLELSKELYELSGWGLDTGRFYNPDGSVMNLSLKELVGELPNWAICPTFDLGYLLRKLPAEVASQEYDGEEARLWLRKDQDLYFGFYAVMTKKNCRSDFGVSADSPEDAAAKLAIELFKQGVLTRE